MRKTSIWILAVCLTAAANALSASVIFTNLTGTNGGSEVALGSGVPITGPQSVAAAFTPTANSIMTQVQLMAQGAADPHFDLYLYSSTGGAPGSSLETLGTDLSAPSIFPTPASVGAFTGFAPLALTAGTQYWLVMTPFTNNSQVAWTTGGSPTVQTDLSPTANGTAPWTPLTLGSATSVQFEIDGTLSPSTPEPAMAGLVGAGLGVLWMLRRARRGADRRI